MRSTINCRMIHQTPRKNHEYRSCKATVRHSYTWIIGFCIFVLRKIEFENYLLNLFHNQNQ